MHKYQPARKKVGTSETGRRGSKELEIEKEKVVKSQCLKPLGITPTVQNVVSDL